MNCATRSIAPLLLLAAAIEAHGEEVRHLFDEKTSQFSLQTEGACGALTVHHDTVRCNPALLRRSGKNMAIMEATSLADEQTFRALWKLATVPLTASDVRSLFSRQSFAAYSGYARFATMSRWFAFEYVPASIFGAYRISNPSLPFIQVSGEKKSSFALTASLDTQDLNPRLPINGALGIKARYNQINRSTIDIDAISAATLRNKNVVKKEVSDGYDTDVGLFLSTTNHWLPNLGFVCTNCLSSEDTFDTAGGIETSGPDAQQSSVHSGVELNPGIGTLWLSGALFWNGFYRLLAWEESAISAGYRIGDFSISSGFSPSRIGWGFLAQRGYYHIGMQYAYEKQPAYFQIEWQQKLYLSLGAAL